MADVSTDLILSGSKKIVEKSFLQIFDHLHKKLKTRIVSVDIFNNGAEKYADYICRKIGVFPLFATNKSAYIADAYISLGLTDNIQREVYRNISDITEDILLQKSGETHVDKLSRKFSFDAINDSSNIFLLLGIPGSGKTTAFRQICIEAAKGKKFRNKIRLPIFISIRDLENSRKPILNAAIYFLESTGLRDCELIIEELISDGLCLFLIDGLDETDKLTQKSIIKEVGELYSRYPSNIFCLSSRPHSLQVGLPSSTKWETLPLVYDERITFVKKWFDVVSPEKGESFLAECDKELGVLDIGSNPLLLSIICALYFNELSVPSEPAELYSRASEGVLGGWDNFRNIARESPLANISMFKRLILCSELAAYLFERRLIVFDCNDVRKSNVIDSLSERFNTQLPDESEILNTLCHDFGILTERSPGLFSFNHLTTQEYLTAKYIIDNRKEIELYNHLHDRRWMEVFQFTIKMLPQADEILRHIFRAMKMENGYTIILAAKITQLKPNLSNDTREFILRELCNKAVSASRAIDASYQRFDDVIDIRFSDHERVRPLQRIIREIKSQNLNPLQDLSSYENEKDSLNSEKPLDNIPHKRKSKSQRKSKKKGINTTRRLNMFAYLDYINNIINDIGIHPRDLNYSNEFLMAVSGEKPTDGFEIRTTWISR